MQKIAIDPAQIIRYTRENKQHLYITLDEMDHIYMHCRLGDKAKLSWFIDYTNYLRTIRQCPVGFCFSATEIDVVTQADNLNTNDKLLWLLLAAFSNHDPHLQWYGNFDLLARWLDYSTVQIGRIVCQLITMDFLKVAAQAGDIKCFTLTLPNKGLLVLKLAPKVAPTPFKEAYKEQDERCTINLFPKRLTGR